ncbi:MAG: 16S rRNA (cytosine(1402)-N(4))-methyltransferase RsmH [Kiritimatiellae bacterium]|nr:16S rRNA (cytosine(1402)-N(4))-methyltransferase RsmH [Kiritimatiellia bacterium]
MHISVLRAEVLTWLDVKPGGTYIDGTLGSGGHALGILERAGRDGTLLGLDQDEQALGRAGAVLADWSDCCRLVQRNFADMGAVAAREGLTAVDGIVLDLGVSSDQLDTPERGFSFQREGPLDMRMNTASGEPASRLVQDLDESALIQIFRSYGEEPRARRIAAAIVRERTRAAIETTTQLADIVERAVGGRKGARHPATRVFQALRIAVNEELESLRQGLDAGLALLKPGGRMAVISFHSLEDRIVKRFCVLHEGRWESLQAGGQRWVGREPRVARLTRKPVCPNELECAENPRARSAKLRVIEKVEE